MATTKGGVFKSKEVATKQVSSLGLMISRDDVKARFQKMLGKKSSGFLSSLLTLTNQSKVLSAANPTTILSAASIAASLDLPINPSLGFAWIVPYGGTATFQIGYKGLIQLAQRSGYMKKIIMTPVYEGEIEDFNRFTEEVKFGEKKSDAVIGYYACIETVNGFTKMAYWSKDDVTKYAKKYSKSYQKGSDIWKAEFDKMACKTVLMSTMKTFAPLSIEMQTAINLDEKPVAITDSGDFVEDVEVDAVTVNEETGEVIEAAKLLSKEQPAMACESIPGFEEENKKA